MTFNVATIRRTLASTRSTYVVCALRLGCCLSICVLLAFGILMDSPYDHYIDINCILRSVWQLEGLDDQTEAWHYEVIWWYCLLSTSFPFRAALRFSDCYIFICHSLSSYSARDPYGRMLQTQKRCVCACRKWSLIVMVWCSISEVENTEHIKKEKKRITFNYGSEIHGTQSVCLQFCSMVVDLPLTFWPIF
jgi:hypothetical protein